MKNKYLEKLNKIEFVVTNACTGSCKHCSEGERMGPFVSIDPSVAEDAVREVAGEYGIKTVMAFGGEPLLCVECVERIMRAARDAGVPTRQVITNGFFSESEERINEVAKRLFAAGVNDLLLSVDAFHQETIPLDTVKRFARAAVGYGIPLRLQPAWLVSEADGNPYNEKTREILKAMSDLGAPVGAGNVIFPEGNALKFLGDYFTKERPQNPYTEDPCQVKCLSFSPNGDVLCGNVYKSGIMEILENYTP